MAGPAEQDLMDEWGAALAEQGATTANDLDSDWGAALAEQGVASDGVTLSHHPLQQFRGLQIKLMIAEYGVIQSQSIPRIDHLHASVRPRFHRGRKRIAGEHK